MKNVTVELLSEHLTEWSLKPLFYEIGEGIVERGGIKDHATTNLMCCFVHLTAAGYFAYKYEVALTPQQAIEDLKAAYLEPLEGSHIFTSKDVLEKFDQLADIAFRAGGTLAQQDKDKEALTKLLNEKGISVMTI